MRKSLTHINSDGNGGLADIEIAVKVAFQFSSGGKLDLLHNFFMV
jgi:hypothetical protein